MAIRDWPAEQRPREKLINLGPQALSDAELLAIFLRTGVQGISAVELAQQLLSEFGGLRSLLKAEQKTFCAAHGLGLAKYAQLQAVLEMAQRHLGESLQRGDALTSPAQTRRYLQMVLRERPYEVFCVLMLDSRHRVIALREMFRGTIDGASVHVREVIKQALHDNAAAVIVAHNHPSGVAEPSQADLAITERLKGGLQMMDIRLLDHFIVGEEVVSLAERGKL